MPLMLPAATSGARSLTGVLPDVTAALTGAASGLGAAASAIVFVIDGLGALQLRTHAGHARFLAPQMGKKDVASSVFPSTTAAALTSLLTGEWPGIHGLVGYRVLDPARGVLVNQLSGWEKEGVDPATWQRVPTSFERASGLRSYAIGLKEYDGSGFTRAILRGAQYVSADSPAERVAAAASLASEPGALVYCYLPELDKAGHRYGVASAQWVSALEIVDAALGAADLPKGVGAIVTADHGMIDVPRHRHVLLDEDDIRFNGVAHVGGEPRLLHVYLEEGEDADAAALRWSVASGATADVATRAEAIRDGAFGPVVDDEVLHRIGDLIVAARGTWAFYDDRLTDKRAQLMIGQHGSTTPEETLVPLIRLGAFARA
ncbi:MAG TPA: alkaline phosphatase family protein [Microbacterium sp.]|uniref:alkaline phosphatase family protein n=1 Tax=Microbacterium sp. TaxID=51671 RepID=UPI002B89EC67|nr:alkaline phosphatase family protein [Microbacterium sp.]HWI31936.1 alkaline phosphatase family protein [Microbacterium sp.]